MRRARLSACGLGCADLFLNGQRVGGERERDPGYTAFDRRTLYVTHDVTDLLLPGPNALGAVLGSGWFDVADLATWGFDKAPWRGPRRLRLALHVEYEDGGAEAVVSDSSWKTVTGPILRDGIYTGEVYDARRELPGWDRAGYPDHAWVAVTALPPPGGALKALHCPPVAVTRTLAPVALTEPQPSVHVADFGRNFSGHVRLRLRADAGTRVTLRYGEVLHTDGTLNADPIACYMTPTAPPQPFQSDVYVCKGGGREEVWEQRFSYSGFQYTQVTGLPHPPGPATLQGWFAHTALVMAEQWQEVQDKMARATGARSGKPRHVRMLSGQTRCPHCGGRAGFKYQKANGRQYAYLVCRCFLAARGAAGERPRVGDLYPVEEVEGATLTAIKQAWECPVSIAAAVRVFRQAQAPEDTGGDCEP